jgi:hypothetical protein
MLRLRHYLFAVPDPSDPSLGWQAGVLWSRWDALLVGIAVLCIVCFAYFYFMSHPNPGATRRFGLLFVALLIAGTLAAYLVIYSSSHELLLRGRVWNSAMALATVVAGLLSTLVIAAIVVLAFLLIGLFPTHWQLRAMRRYPFRRFP